MSQKPPILFIHGAIIGPDSWNEMRASFEASGYPTSAPAWPHKDMSVRESREHPDKDLAKVGLEEIVAHYESIIKSMPIKPVLVGHSFGGLVVQILRSRGYGSAAVAIDSAPAKGVFSFYPSVVKGTQAGLRAWVLRKGVFLMTFEEFQYAFVNGLPESFQRAAYDAQVMYETARPFFQAAIKDFPGQNACKVDFGAHPEIPLLMTGGTHDHLCPEKMTHANWEKYSATTVRADYKVFDGATHWIMAQPETSTEVAAYIKDWLEV